MKKRMLSLLPMLLVANGYAGTMGPIEDPARYSYVGVFGGGGSLSSTSLTQFGTAFFSPVEGGPLSVNATGRTSSASQWIVGGQAGHYFSDALLPVMAQWSVLPAAEIEGYYIGKNTVTAGDISSNNTRLPEHNFAVNYSMSAGVGLVNALATFNHPDYVRWHPYVAGGVGAASVAISNASSLQTSPVEAINHFSTYSASDTAFASQAKVGLSFDCTPHLSIFGEYRYLYLGATNYVVGSTLAAGHVETTSWNLNMGSQSYNMGIGGIRYLF